MIINILLQTARKNSSKTQNTHQQYMINKPTTYNNSGYINLPSFKTTNGRRSKGESQGLGKVYRRIFFLFLIMMMMGVGSVVNV